MIIQEGLSSWVRLEGGPIGSSAGELKVEGFGFLYEMELQGLEKILPLSTEDLQCCDTTGIF